MISLPEPKEVMFGLLQEHCSDIEHLASSLGKQREDQLVDAANEALYLTGIILRKRRTGVVMGLRPATQYTLQATNSNRHCRQKLRCLDL